MTITETDLDNMAILFAGVALLCAGVSLAALIDWLGKQVTGRSLLAWLGKIMGKG